ncbi:unnamed protein product [Arctogadus glacialis]
MGSCGAKRKLTHEAGLCPYQGFLHSGATDGNRSTGCPCPPGRYNGSFPGFSFVPFSCWSATRKADSIMEP